jgi:serine/threonine protein kinase
MAEGLRYIHSNNLVHRDIKPDNILISASTTDVVLKISDFGLCKETSIQGSYSQSGVKGTLHYMSPEMLELMGRPDELQRTRGKKSSDVFAMGCVFYYFLTRGQHPFGRGYDVPNNVKRNESVFHGKCCP